MPGRDVIVVGASAGGVEALTALAAGLPPDLPAAVFVVLHFPPHGRSHLPGILRRAGPLPAEHAADGRAVEPGRIYVAAPDRHLLLEDGRMRLTRGPRENRTRPAADPLFRSAAVAYGPRAVGVVLTGLLDDGAAGLWAVKDRGGVAVVQDPAEAPYPSMPANAARQVEVDHVLRVADMPPVLARLAAEEVGGVRGPAPEDMRLETRIAMGDKPLEAGIGTLGVPSAFTCPECHGTLLQIKQAGGGPRFRCHTGHAYAAGSLLAELTGSVEDTLWGAVRAVQESALLMRHLARHARDAGDEAAAAAYERKAGEAQSRSELVRQVVMAHEALSGDAVGDPPGG
jgi:two-component system chemotaxis response regulator CheB